ncbi:MAG: hypothetical protein IJ493_01250 [Clostridia bacterium]|nr:hypothetical protein [Clostridia bacterium]
MTAIFLELVNRSYAALWLVLAILLLRLLTRRLQLPRWIHMLAWGLVGLRLVLPDLPESTLSLQPSAAVLETADSMAASSPVTVTTGFATANSVINPAMEQIAQASPSIDWTWVASVVWLIGGALMLLWSIVGYIRLRIRLRDAVRDDGVWLSDRIDTPFVLGRRIYLPFSLADADRHYVIAHERAHIRRGDTLLKPLAWVLLSIYWFNPLLWAAYILLSRDMELACDQRVLRELGEGCRRAYSTSLLSCSVRRQTLAACPLAFGEVSVKQRIASLLHYKKPALWVIAAALFICALLAVFFLTNPKVGADPTNDSDPVIDFSIPNYTYTVEELLAEDLRLSSIGDPSMFGALLITDSSLTIYDPDGGLLFSSRECSQEELDRDDLEEINTLLTAPLDLPDSSSLTAYYYLGGEPDNVYWTVYFDGDRPLWLAQGRTLRFYSLARARMSYVSAECLYMSPASSQLPTPNNGVRYLFDGDSVIFLDRDTGAETALFENVVWGEFPWSQAEWNDMMLVNLPLGENLRFASLNDRWKLVESDGALWIVDYRDATGGSYIWSVYRLISDGGKAAAVAFAQTAFKAGGSDKLYQYGAARCENRGKLSMSMAQHLPVMRITRAESLAGQLEDLRERYGGSDSLYEHFERYDEDFFAENELYLICVTAPSGGDRYEVTSAMVGSGELLMTVTKTQDGDTCDMADWLMAVEIAKSNVRDCGMWDAVLQ